MRIRLFSKNVENSLLPYTLNNSTVVIDAQNFLYNVYEKVGLPYQFGCESDKYAYLLREHLKKYQTANVKCLFVFKGGHEHIENKLNRIDKSNKNWRGNQKIVLPVFMKEVYKEVLTEMGFSYVICEYEAKLECVALAQNFKCPILSFDVEFCFYNTFYIPYSTIKQDASTLTCGRYELQKFLQKHRLTKDKFAMFAVICDENVFDENYFNELFAFVTKGQQLYKSYKRNECIIKWLSRTDENEAQRTIERFIKSNDKEKFLKEKARVKQMMDAEESGGIPTKYLMNHEGALVINNDTDWFEKGVVGKHIAICYVNLVHSSMFLGSWCIEDTEANDALKLSLDIIKYAFNLLTNYENDGFKFHIKATINFEHIDVKKNQVPNPWDGKENVFANGWTKLRSLGLFEHFITHTIPDFNIETINKIPEDAQLLALALIYFSHKKSCDVKSEVISVILSYVMLGVVSKIDNTKILKYKLDEADCRKAENSLKEYFTVTQNEIRNILDRKLLHPLVEFQHCLAQLNNLNRLCGAPFKPTVYNTTFNGTFVYKILFDIKNEFNDGWSFVQNKYGRAVTVLRFSKSIIDVVLQN